jgi:lipid-A-disaccharide synthase
MVEKPLKLCLIAGEASGDQLGGKLMAALKLARPSVHFIGIGGERMTGQGMQSLFPMSDLSLMGFAEILPHLPKLLTRINQTVAMILREQPDAVITIDSPGFCYRVAKKLREHKVAMPLIHYVAPTVWAYKPERAAKTAALFDKLLVLLPFEPPYFEKEGLETVFVGHPILEDPIAPKTAGTALLKEFHIPHDADIISVFAGSRNTELKQLLPVFKETLETLHHRFPRLHVLMPTVPHLYERVKQETALWQVPVSVLLGSEARGAALAASKVALVKSGTISLEVARMGVPMIVAYKVGRITHQIVKRLIRVRYASIVNLLLDKEVIPEFIQKKCRASLLASALTELLEKPEGQSREVAQALTMLGEGNPSERAAGAVLESAIKK